MSDAADKGPSKSTAPVAPGQPALRDLVDYLARGLVDHPEEVEVEEIAEPDALVFELKVAEQDLGKVIGKQGRTAPSFKSGRKTPAAAPSKPAGRSGWYATGAASATTSP